MPDFDRQARAKIGRMIEEGRRSRAWTIKELAERTGFSTNTIGNATLGAPIPLSTLKTICDALDLPFQQILFDGDTTLASSATTGQRFPTARRKIFIIHGHDESAREMVARFLERLDLDVVILHEKSNQGRTIIEKVEAYSDVEFAIVLLTPDDVGGKTEADLRYRARQNVLLEWGYFIGKLGRRRVWAFKKGEIDLPSDVLGVVWETLDDHGNWRLSLAKELQEAGISVNWQRVAP
jgi:predicted nucleotide-binding protein/DNA-binding Xre family transcriptional regulator